MRTSSGAVACGHQMTLDAAAETLRAGGNAFDAAIAALWMACVAEPALASPGGGGFLLARPVGERPRVYDFFAHTPSQRLPPGTDDFREVLVDFGPAQQPFHIGLGSAAVPGVVGGAFRVVRDLGRLPPSEVMGPAVAAASEGVKITELQAYAISVLAPILEDTEGVRSLFHPEGRLLAEGDLFRPNDLADFLETLAREGEDLFYRGEVSEVVDRAFRNGGGHLRRSDFERYEVLVREPLEVEYGGRRVWTNPPPASGGFLLSFGLRVLSGILPEGRPWSAEAARRTALALAAMQEVRQEEDLEEGVGGDAVRRLLGPEAVARYRELVRRHPTGRGGTTHISVLDGAGNAAALSVSNGEGCGWVVPGAGFMLNNMLGEADLQPRGLGRWPTDSRLGSMMAPTLVEGPEPGCLVAMGSGGSSRIRSAVLQVILALADFDLSLEEAVSGPRLHLEEGRLEIEGGFEKEVETALAQLWTNHRAWPGQGLFFGGVHAAAVGKKGMAAAGDPRRGGAAAVV